MIVIVFEQGAPKSAVSQCEKILDLPESRCSLLKVVIFYHLCTSSILCEKKSDYEVAGHVLG